VGFLEQGKTTSGDIDKKQIRVFFFVIFFVIYISAGFVLISPCPLPQWGRGEE
jgi:hypothetical protein